MHEALYEEMFEMEQRHWWFAAKHRIIIDLLGRKIRRGNEKPKIADLGCGCGMMLWWLKDRYDVAGVDGAPKAIEFCAKRGVPVQLGALPDEIPLAKGTF